MNAKDQFHSNPLINPISGKTIKINSKEYQKLVQKYGPVKIKSPKTKRLITVGKDAYNNLLKEGYTDDQLINQDEKLNNDIYHNLEEELALKLIDNILSSKTHDAFFIDNINIRDLSSLPKEFIISMMNHPQDAYEGVDVAFYINAKKGIYEITLYYITDNIKELDRKEKLTVTLNISQDQLLTLLTEIFENHKNTIFDFRGKFLTYNDFRNVSKMKQMFSTW
jgi:hypothetical protein